MGVSTFTPTQLNANVPEFVPTLRHSMNDSEPCAKCQVELSNPHVQALTETDRAEFKTWVEASHVFSNDLVLSQAQAQCYQYYIQACNDSMATAPKKNKVALKKYLSTCLEPEHDRLISQANLHASIVAKLEAKIGDVSKTGTSVNFRSVSKTAVVLESLPVVDMFDDNSDFDECYEDTAPIAPSNRVSAH